MHQVNYKKTLVLHAGMLAYSSMAGLSAYGLRLAAAAPQQQPSDAADRLLRTAVLSLGAVMASCSGYLM